MCTCHTGEKIYSVGKNNNNNKKKKKKKNKNKPKIIVMTLPDRNKTPTLAASRDGWAGRHNEQSKEGC